MSEVHGEYCKGCVEVAMVVVVVSIDRGGFVECERCGRGKVSLSLLPSACDESSWWWSSSILTQEDSHQAVVILETLAGGVAIGWLWGTPAARS